MRSTSGWGKGAHQFKELQENLLAQSDRHSLSSRFNEKHCLCYVSLPYLGRIQH